MHYAKGIQPVRFHVVNATKWIKVVQELCAALALHKLEIELLAQRFSIPGVACNLRARVDHTSSRLPECFARDILAHVGPKL
jgi:hypothetical protein